MLDKNLKALSESNEILAKQIKEQTPPDWMDEIKSKNGAPNFLFEKNGRIIPAYDIKDPKKEAQECIKANKPLKEDLTILVGAGFGYLVDVITKKMEKGHHILLIEPNLYFVKRVLSTYNLAKYLRSGNLLIIDGKNKEEIGQLIVLIDGNVVVNNFNFILENYVKQRKEYEEITKYVSETINQLRCNTGTVSSSGAIMADNDIANLPYVIRHRGVNELKDLFKGCPAVLVSTGPSLGKNVYLLKAIQNKCIIIAVAQALRVLLAYDIRPDFICTVDFGEVNMSHLKGLMDSDVPLVCLNRTYAPLLKEYQGPKFIVATPTPGFEHTAAGVLKDKGAIEQGGSVCHLCMGFATHLGCNPVTFIGQDLAYGNEEGSHIKQVDSGGNIRVDDQGMLQWKVTDTRSHLYGEEYPMGPACYVEGYYGGEVLTNLGLMSFLHSCTGLVKQAKEQGITFMNSTCGGAHIQGTERIHLSTFINKYMKEELKKDDKIKKFLSLADDAGDLINESIPKLKNDIKVLNEILKNARKGLKTCSKLVELKQEAAIRRELKKNEIYAKEAQKYSRLNPLVALSIYGASRTIFTRNLKVNGKVEHILKNKDDFKIRVKRSRLILDAAFNAATQLKKSYRTTLDILEKYQKTKNEDLLVSEEKYKIDLNDAESYFAAGNFAHPLLDARKFMKSKMEHPITADEYNTTISIIKKAEEMRTAAIEKGMCNLNKNTQNIIKANKLIKESQKLGLEEKHQEALDALIEANDLMSNDSRIMWGLATANFYVGKLDESLRWYNKLVDKEPNKKRFKYEKALCLLNVDMQKGLETFLELVNETGERFKPFMKNIAKLCFHAELYEDAKGLYEEYLEKFDYDYIVWNELGDCYSKLGNKEKAIEIFKKADFIKFGK